MKFNRLSKYKTGGTGSKMLLSLPLPKTPDGRVYRFSPNEAADPRHFVLGDIAADVGPSEALSARMKVAPDGEETVCPYSGVTGAADTFTHPEDQKAAMELPKHLAAQDALDQLTDAFKGIKGFTVTKGARPSAPKPRFSRRDLMRELICDHCGRDYGVFAIGLFCPGCGAPNVRLHFAREAELVGAQVEVAEAQGDGKEELAYRLLGNAHEDVLTAFEATQKAVYIHGKLQAGASEPPKVGNDFQNVEKATKRFAQLGFNPFEDLTDTERAVLLLNIQKRHIIGHNLGVVDDKFATHAADAKVGETVHLVGEDIRTFAAICQKVVDRLDAWLGGSPSPTIGDDPVLATIKEPPVSPDDPKNLMALDVDLSLLARKIALWTAEQCQDGMGIRLVNSDRLREAFAENTEAELAEALAELSMEDFIQTSHGHPLPSYRPLLELYLNFDEPAFGTNVTADTIELAERVLAGDDGVNVGDLFKATGWEQRRFNPIVGYVVAQVRKGPVSKSLDPEFPTRSFHLHAEDRLAIKRFVQRLKG